MRFDLPMPVVAKTPTWLASVSPLTPTGKSTSVSPERSRPTSRSPIRSRRKSKTASVGALTRVNWAGRDLGFMNSPPGVT